MVEIGPGTGKLTEPLLRHGISVTAIEPGPRMVAFLTRRFEETSDLEIIGSRFEDADLPVGAFDAVAAASAFHWIDPERRYQLACRALRPRGRLVLVTSDRVIGTANERYHRGVAPIYERLAPEVGLPYVPPAASEIDAFGDPSAMTELFEEVAVRRFDWDHALSTDSLIGLLRTYSNHRALPARRRATLLREIRTFVHEELGGHVLERFVTTLWVGRKRVGP